MTSDADGAASRIAEHERATRDWWLRTVLVLQRPRAVFVALRDDSRETAGDRSEQVLLVIWLAGIAYALTSPTAGHLKDDPSYDGLVIAIWAFIAGGLAGTAGYWVIGAILHWSVRGFGSQGTYRRTRHLLAFAAVPLALSLLIWPFKLAVYGQDLFARGGSDRGTGWYAFGVLELGFLLWAAALLVIGVRAVHGWTWRRAAAACVLAVVTPTLLGVVVATL